MSDGAGRLRLIQYWDTGAPPPEVAALMRTWAEDAAFDYTAYDRDTALDYLRRHFRRPVRAAFRKCRIPAMQADFFRYCALLAGGGVYVDADTANGGGMAAMLSGAGRGCLMNRRGKIANDFLYFAAPGDPLMSAVVAQAMANIEAEVSQNVWLVTGPGILTGMHQDPDRAALFEGLRILPVQDVAKVVQFRWDLAYKAGTEDWRVTLKDKDGSIYN